MATSYPERLDEARLLESAGLGLTVIPLQDRDVLLVKDPSYNAPGDQDLPEDQRAAPMVWREYPGGAAKTAYGL
jgi:hypothetical protein